MGPATTASFGPIGVGGPALSSSANFDDEEPLLDELGIHPDQIWRKTKFILNPFRVNPAFYKDSDLSGPIFLYLSLCLFQLLAGKIQFGVILGWIVVSSIFLYVVFNMLAGRNGNLDLHTCTSVVGYCLLPVVIFSVVLLFVPQGGPVRFVVAGVFVVWATRACTNLMVAVADGGEEHRGLIASCLVLSFLGSALSSGGGARRRESRGEGAAGGGATVCTGEGGDGGAARGGGGRRLRRQWRSEGEEEKMELAVPKTTCASEFSCDDPEIWTSN
ncbi:hypothetical protein Tsubulata_021672 [Turnera subulata]|uniref:Protein YIP n=1 Tax=Turnera subulata TaxID=218843 RepID=A0A9Q0FHB5_9ROSI|nr:hypothetical protein Tsubulata_021672 [Turnera subulata]